jgi:hypothetical protein
MKFCPRLLIESKYDFQERHFADYRKYISEKATIEIYIFGSGQISRLSLTNKRL